MHTKEPRRSLSTTQRISAVAFDRPDCPFGFKFLHIGNSKMDQVCCPSANMACPGCVDLQGSTCDRCDTGLVKSQGRGTCVIGSDVEGWEDPSGFGCSHCESKGWCKDGAPTPAGEHKFKQKLICAFSWKTRWMDCTVLFVSHVTLSF